MNKAVLVVVVWAAAAGLALTRTLDLGHAGALAAIVTALALAWPDPAPPGPSLPDLPHLARPGARRDLSELSWSALERDGVLGYRALRRLHTLAGPDAAPPDQRLTPAQAVAWLDQLSPDEGDR
jgi:hypothetical protein